MTTLFARNSISRPPLRRGLPVKQQLPRSQITWIIRGVLLIPLALAWLALSPLAQAVNPPPDGGYPNGNTAEGEDALFNLTTGVFNTANGNVALFSNTTGSYNTGNGAGALASNTAGDSNTASGYVALFSNHAGSYNTASGSAALASNTTGIWNTASGWGALNQNIDGSYNTASGLQALFSNTSGSNNTACGLNALFSNSRGSNNIGVGIGAGGALTTGSNNIDIGNAGVAGESKKIRIGTQGMQNNTYIAGIYGATVARGVGVIIDSAGHLGTTTSSARFKDNIEPMDKASEAILALQPVTFRYKHDLDPDGIPQFGLVAEQVEKVNPDLVARDEQGKAYTVRYEAVNAMLLNEFLKEHRKGQEQTQINQQQEATITQMKSTLRMQEAMMAQQEKEIRNLIANLKEQAAQIQKVSDQLELSKATPQLVVNHR